MNESIIKSDRRGRLRYTTEHKQALIEAYENSGLSGPKFAELHGVNYQTLAYWLKKLRPGGGGNPALVSLVAAEVDRDEYRQPQAPPLEVLLPGGARLVIHTLGQAESAARLIRELQSVRPC